MATSADSDYQTPVSRFGQLIAAARAGDQSALGDLLQECRDYLLLVANQDLDGQVRQKIGPSDVVQESLLTAQASFDQFQGTDREELLAWMRQILKNDMRQAFRHYVQTDRRQVNRESPIDDSRQLGARLPDREYTPSTQAGIHEEGELLQRAMSELSEEYQQVIRMRNWQKMTYAKIGEQTGRSEEAARKMWARAIVSLKDRLHRVRDT